MLKVFEKSEVHNISIFKSKISRHASKRISLIKLKKHLKILMAIILWLGLVRRNPTQNLYLALALALLQHETEKKKKKIL